MNAKRRHFIYAADDTNPVSGWFLFCMLFDYSFCSSKIPVRALMQGKPAVLSPPGTKSESQRMRVGAQRLPASRRRRLLVSKRTKTPANGVRVVLLVFFFSVKDATIRVRPCNSRSVMEVGWVFSVVLGVLFCPPHARRAWAPAGRRRGRCEPSFPARRAARRARGERGGLRR